MAIHDNHVMEEPSIRLWQRAYYFLLLLQQISLPLYHRHVRRNVEPKVRQDTVSFAPKQYCIVNGNKNKHTWACSWSSTRCSTMSWPVSNSGRTTRRYGGLHANSNYTFNMALERYKLSMFPRVPPYVFWPNGNDNKRTIVKKKNTNIMSS